MDAEKIIGTVLLALAALSTCVNESRLVRSALSLEEARGLALALAAPEALERHDGRLVHFSGLIQTPANSTLDGGEAGHARVNPFVMDPVFGVAVKGVRLHRSVEMLQWVETSHTSTSSTPEDEDRRADDERERIYLYDLEWREEVIDSRTFNDMSYWNPPEDAWQYRSLVVKAENLLVGDFALPDALVDQIQRKDAVSLDAASRRAMASVLQQRHGADWKLKSALPNASIEEDQYVYLRQDSMSRESALGDLRQDSMSRESALGDLRVSFTVTPNYPVTVCAKQSKGGSLAPFTASNGEDVFLLEEGVLPLNELIDKKLSTKNRENWFFRLFSSVLGFIGFLVLRPLIIARYGRFVTSIQQHLLASSLSVGLTFVVVGINWIMYRPLWAIGATALGCSPALAVVAWQHFKLSVKND